MSRRWISKLSRHSVSMAIVCGFAGLAFAHPAFSAEKVTFSLRNTSPVPIAEAVFQPVATGTIVPTVTGNDSSGQPIEGSPLTSLPSSQGVDLSHAFTLLLSDPSTGGDPRDFLSLIFGFNPNPNYPSDTDPDAPPFVPAVDGNGNQIGRLDPDGHFDFELNLSDAGLANLIVPTTSGLALSVVNVTPPPDPTPTPDPGPSPSPEPLPIPEPSAWLLWGLVTGGAAFLARRRSKGSRTEFESAALLAHGSAEAKMG
jgi:hypothetical protein